MATRRTRAVLLVLAALTLVAVPAAQASHQFTDVPNDHPFHTEIGIFKDSNITSGCTATTFCPDDFVKRQAMAAFIDRALGLVVRPGESVLRGVPGSRVAMLDDGSSLVQTNAGGLELSHGGFRGLRIVAPPNPTPGFASPNVIGGFSGNLVAAGAMGATIAGGGIASTGAVNRVTDSFGFVGGGFGNHAGDNAGTADDRGWATVGGGSANTASGSYAVVLGGVSNSATASSAAVGGGNGNHATGATATVAGGSGNIASGNYAAIPGGASNAASGAMSFAAGNRANATHTGSFVWGDGANFDIGSNANNSFTARAVGGARFVSAIDAITGAPTAGVTLSAGGGSWASLSDRAAKRNFRPLDRQALLRRLARLPMSSWSYRSQPASIRHLGPMAQDFRRAFGVGEDSRHITSVDADGVALAAIQALYARNLRLERRNRALAGRLAAIERQLAALATQR